LPFPLLPFAFDGVPIIFCPFLQCRESLFSPKWTSSIPEPPKANRHSFRCVSPRPHPLTHCVNSHLLSELPPHEFPPPRSARLPSLPPGYNVLCTCSFEGRVPGPRFLFLGHPIFASTFPPGKLRLRFVPLYRHRRMYQRMYSVSWGLPGFQALRNSCCSLEDFFSVPGPRTVGLGLRRVFPTNNTIMTGRFFRPGGCAPKHSPL